MLPPHHVLHSSCKKSLAVGVPRRVSLVEALKPYGLCGGREAGLLRSEDKYCFLLVSVEQEVRGGPLFSHTFSHFSI